MQHATLVTMYQQTLSVCPSGLESSATLLNEPQLLHRLLWVTCLIDSRTLLTVVETAFYVTAPQLEMLLYIKSLLVPCSILSACSPVIMEYFYQLLLLVFVVCIYNSVNHKKWDAFCYNILKLVIILFFQLPVRIEVENAKAGF